MYIVPKSTHITDTFPLPFKNYYPIISHTFTSCNIDPNVSVYVSIQIGNFIPAQISRHSRSHLHGPQQSKGSDRCNQMKRPWRSIYPIKDGERGESLNFSRNDGTALNKTCWLYLRVGNGNCVSARVCGRTREYSL